MRARLPHSSQAPTSLKVTGSTEVLSVISPALMIIVARPPNFFQRSIFAMLDVVMSPVVLSMMHH